MDTKKDNTCWIKMETRQEQIALLKRMVNARWVPGVVSLGCKFVESKYPWSLRRLWWRFLDIWAD